MRDWNPHQCAGGRSGQRLETVTEQHYDVRLEALENISEACKSSSARTRDRDRSVTGEVHRHFSIDRETVLAGFDPQCARTPAQMHRRRHDLKLHVRAVRDPAHQPMQEPVFRSSACHHTDAARGHGVKMACTRRVVRIASASVTASFGPPRTAATTRSACKRAPGLYAPSQACGSTGLSARSPAF